MAGGEDHHAVSDAQRVHVVQHDVVRLRQQRGFALGKAEEGRKGLVVCEGHRSTILYRHLFIPTHTNLLLLHILE